MSNSKAILIVGEREELSSDSLVELIIWQLPAPVPGCTHPYKYRLVYVLANECVLRYDNERGKGDHRHFANAETLDRLLADFRIDLKILQRMEVQTMKTVTICVSSIDDVMKRAQAAINGKPQGAHFSYATPELLFRTFTTPRWQIIRAMTGAGPMSIRELSRRLERDVKGVHRDVKALLEAGLLEHDESGAIVFPYDTVHVNFTLKAADLARPAAAQAQSIEAPTAADSAESPRNPRRRAAPRKSAPRPAGNR